MFIVNLGASGSGAADVHQPTAMQVGGEAGQVTLDVAGEIPFDLDGLARWGGDDDLDGHLVQVSVPAGSPRVPALARIPDRVPADRRVNSA